MVCFVRFENKNNHIYVGKIAPLSAKKICGRKSGIGGKQMKKRLSFLLALWMLVFSLGGVYVTAEEISADTTEDDLSLIVTGKDEEVPEEEEEGSIRDVITDDDYLKEHENAPAATTEVEIAGGDFTEDNGASVEVLDVDGKKNVLKWDTEEGSVSWTFEVPKTGM